MRIAKWTAVATAVAILAAVFAGLWLRRSGGSAMAPELPRNVPRSGLMIRSLYGKATPLPVPLAGGGRVYGSSLKPTDIGGWGGLILEGVHEDPDEVAGLCLKQMLPAKPKYYKGEGTRSSRHVYFRFGNPSGRVGIEIMTHPEGLSSDFKVWDEEPRAGKGIGGDPSETKVLIGVSWPARPGGPGSG
jgi:hypothetical protein